MQKLTQSRPDNCWQTCVAMLLNCVPSALPEQELFPEHQRYADVLRAFLAKHYDVTYVELAAGSVAIPSDMYHLMIGETERTSPEHDKWHAVIGIGGRFYWDVFPSRVGLTRVVTWGLLTPIPAEWRAKWQTQKIECVCPACSGNEKVARAS